MSEQNLSGWSEWDWDLSLENLENLTHALDSIIGVSYSPQSVSLRTAKTGESFACFYAWGEIVSEVKDQFPALIYVKMGNGEAAVSDIASIGPAWDNEPNDNYDAWNHALGSGAMVDFAKVMDDVIGVSYIPVAFTEKFDGKTESRSGLFAARGTAIDPDGKSSPFLVSVGWEEDGNTMVLKGVEEITPAYNPVNS